MPLLSSSVLRGDRCFLFVLAPFIEQQRSEDVKGRGGGGASDFPPLVLVGRANKVSGHRDISIGERFAAVSMMVENNKLWVSDTRSERAVIVTLSQIAWIGFIVFDALSWPRAGAGLFSVMEGHI